jgi:nicotinamide mononucleotide (NMN) deamidase PncC
MSGTPASLIEAIQSSGYKAVLVLTGGGVGAVHAILAHPGASRFVLDVQIPYCPEALAEYLGHEPVSACSEETARQLAQTAFNHASRLTSRAALGVACTAALQTTRARRGSDRAFICIQSSDRTIFQPLEIDPGTRSQQDAWVSGSLLAKMYECVGVDS